jgi:hypothetical protein
MKIITVTFITIFSCLFSFAQGNFAFGLESHTNYSDVIFSNNNYSYIVESGNFNMGGTLFTEYRFSDHFSMSLGIGYSRVSSKTPIYLGGQFVDSAGVITYPSGPEEFRSIYKHHYLSVPVLFHYTFGQNFRLSMGGIADFSIANKVTNVITSPSGNSTNTVDEVGLVPFNPVVPSAYAGIGWDFWHLNNLVVFVQPYTKFQLTYIKDNSSNLNRRFISYGLSVGIRL